MKKRTRILDHIESQKFMQSQPFDNWCLILVDKLNWNKFRITAPQFYWNNFDNRRIK